MEIKIKLISFKSSERINEKGDGPYRLLKHLNFVCFLPQPGIVHVNKHGLDCLTNVAVGCFLDTKLVSS